MNVVANGKRYSSANSSAASAVRLRNIVMVTPSLSESASLRIRPGQGVLLDFRGMCAATHSASSASRPPARSRRIWPLERAAAPMARSALTMQLLAWIAARPRSYQDIMEAWRTTCPRLTIWEDAVGDGLVFVESAQSMKDARVLLTESGRALLQTTPVS